MASERQPFIAGSEGFTALLPSIEMVQLMELHISYCRFQAKKETIEEHPWGVAWEGGPLPLKTQRRPDNGAGQGENNCQQAGNQVSFINLTMYESPSQIQTPDSTVSSSTNEYIRRTQCSYPDSPFCKRFPNISTPTEQHVPKGDILCILKNTTLIGPGSWVNCFNK